LKNTGTHKVVNRHCTAGVFVQNQFSSFAKSKTGFQFVFSSGIHKIATMLRHSRHISSEVNLLQIFENNDKISLTEGVCCS